jgi:ATP-dependent exoDNAse (exonuclease V) beta subunit
MSNSVLEKDKDIRFPHFVVLKASAGSGKIHTLTKRYVQYGAAKLMSLRSLRLCGS